MSRLSRTLAVGASVLIGLATVTAVLVFSVTYKPYGVPDLLREDYEEKVREIKRRNELLAMPEAQSKLPIATFDKRVHDFGRLDPHSTAEHSFRVTNTGAGELVLAVRETSCKCTVGTLEKSTLDPGESTKVTLTWNTGYKAEDYEQAALLITNDPTQENVTLKVKGSVRSDLVVPGSLTLSSGDIGGTATGTMMIYSQLWETFTIDDLETTRDELEWFVEPVDLPAPELVDQDPKSAWKLHVSMPLYESGLFSEDVSLRVNPGNGDKAIEKQVKVSWKTRSPIAFLGPEIHKETGYELPTLESNRRHEFPVLVRLRGKDQRDLAVLDFEPEELEVTMVKADRVGDYRLTIAIPKGCPSVTFNRDDKHGYVQVGDPDDPDFQNWMPIHGAVFQLD